MKKEIRLYWGREGTTFSRFVFHGSLEAAWSEAIELAAHYWETQARAVCKIGVSCEY